MKSRILSFILCFGVVAISTPSIEVNASIETARLYNVKSSVLGVGKYDDAYDTNEDGNVNVFDVIRINKEVVQGESYNDLKNKVSVLEQQIQVLIEQLANKEESKGNEFSDEDKAKLEVLENYDDTEIKQRLESLHNYDDTEIREKLDSLKNYDDTALKEGKVDKEEGKGLSSNDFTDKDKAKLDELSNYDDTEIKKQLEELHNYDDTEIREILKNLNNYDDTALKEGKVDKEEGKGLSSNDFTDEEKFKLEGLKNYDDTEIREKLNSLENYDDTEIKKQLESLYNYDDTEIKEKLDNLHNYDDTEIRERLDSLENYDDTALKEGKVDKEDGKVLSSNDFTDEYRAKLDNLENYDDTEIKKQLEGLHNYDDTEIREKLDGLSNYDDTEIKKQLEGLHNYDDTEIKKQLEGLHNYDDTEIREKLEELHNYDDTEIREKLDDFIKIGKGTNYPTIKEGFEIAISLNKAVIIEPGTYDLVSEGISGIGYILPKKVVGYGVTLLCNLPEENWNLSPLNCSYTSPMDVEVYGLTVICSNCRYNIHDDMGAMTRGNYYRHVFKDLTLINNSGVSSVLLGPNNIGGGFGDNGDVIVENCVMKSKGTVNSDYHSSFAEVQTKGCTAKFVNCVCDKTISATNLGSSTDYINEVYVSGCLLGRQAEQNGSNNIKLTAWNNEIMN